MKIETFQEYQTLVGSFAAYPTLYALNEDSTYKPVPWIYPALGLPGEVGEICEKLKKVLRDDNCELSEEKRTLIKKELGDILWYVATLCRELEINLEDVATTNIIKLQDRKERDRLGGSGDER